MPVKSPPRERPLLLMFLSEYKNGAWKAAVPDWVEERMDGAVEVVAEREDGLKLAIEHTIVQPFVYVFYSLCHPPVLRQMLEQKDGSKSV